MPAKTTSADLERIGCILLNSVQQLFAEPDYDDDAGDIRFLDRDDRCVWLGLFPTDDNGEPISDKPVAVWTFEISYEQSAQKGDVQ